MRTLNKDKPYATIHQSENHNGQHFEQDNIVFDAQGHEWVAPPQAPRAAAAPAADDSAFQEAVQDAVAAQLGPVLAELAALRKAVGGDELPNATPEALAAASAKTKAAFEKSEADKKANKNLAG